MKVPTTKIKELRELSGAGIMECRSALIDGDGDLEKAVQCLREKGLVKAKKKATRVTNQGVVEAYIHAGGRIGAMVELNCESDFVARTDEFKELAHALAMQVAALSPQCVSIDDVPEEGDIDTRAACLLLQPYIKNPEQTIQDIITETIAKVGENIKVSRFARFELGE